jgi:hypothetical protein
MWYWGWLTTDQWYVMIEQQCVDNVVAPLSSQQVLIVRIVDDKILCSVWFCMLVIELLSRG